jgi:hypothetical protein
MKTAMQELMQIIDIKSMVHNDKEVLMILSNLKAHAIGLLEKEKEQIIKAMSYSTYREMKGINVSNEEYYNQTYNQNK